MSGHFENVFFTPRRIAREKAQWMESCRGRLLIASCRSGSSLASSVARRYRELLGEDAKECEVPYLEGVDLQFSDSETCVRLASDVSGYDVFLFQALYDPVSNQTVDRNYLALFIAARTFREWGANSITAILPYLAYARQDKPTKFEREPATAKLMADLSTEAGIDRVVTWHPHSDQIRGFYGKKPIDALESLPLFIEEFRRFQGREDTIAIAPDAGASKLVTYFSRTLGLKSAITSKYRPRPEQAAVSEIIGDFSEKRIAVILDDMIGTAGTMHTLIRELVEKRGIEEVYLGVSHNLCLDPAYDRLLDLRTYYHLKELIITDSVPQTDRFKALPFLKIRSLADTMARIINRIHYNREVSGLF
ncbi:MAG: ribose-phosphate diphosphokinase [bacterium]